MKELFSCGMDLKRLFLAGCVLLTMSSCVETIVMDPHEEMPAVVYCVLTNKSDVQTLDLSAAESPSGVKPEMKAKEVVVWAGSRERYVFQNAGGTKWTARFRPVPLEKYSLHVTLEGGGELVAETTFPDTVAINDHYEEGGVSSERGFDRLFDERADPYSIAETRYSSNTRQYGFKLMEPTEKSFSFTEIIRYDPRYWVYTHDERSGFEDALTEEEEKNNKVALWEKHPYQRACYLWITARSPQRQEEFPLNELYVPGHDYQSVYLATDNTAVDNFNALQLTLGDLSCYSSDNIKRIEDALEERDIELIPAWHNRWKNAWNSYDGDLSWYGRNLMIADDFYKISKYADLPLHHRFLRIVYPEGGYKNQYSLSDPSQRYNMFGDAIWIRDKPMMEWRVSANMSRAPVSPRGDWNSFVTPSPFTFQLFADFNLEDPYSWQRCAKRLSSGWVVFEFHVVSEEYDTFLRTLYKSGFNDVFGDLTQSLFSREGVYSNVKGGAGIFGAECVTVSLR